MPDTLTNAPRSIVAQLPENLPGAATERLSEPGFDGVFEAWSGSAESDALALLELAAAFAVAPVSGFHVGAVAVGGSGKLYIGANMEFSGAALSATLHAEQAAVLNAWIHGETALGTIAVNAAPCGLCRQFMLELPASAELRVLRPGQPAARLADLIPAPFGGGRGSGEGLLDSAPSALEAVRDLAGPREAVAVEQARRSYCPYTHSPEGFALSTGDGACFAGRTAESIAFNPGVPAVVCALSQRNLSASRDHAVLHACNARLITSLAPQKRQTEAILSCVARTSLEEVLLEPA